ncbi:MAG: lamin tail domain-containing protein [Verrucomicrobiae bacterium]|nr:lamin tail domain-containing protein [Verrucomicrobiae bacterium]
MPAGAYPAGAGYTHYRWRLDGGPWSAETPIGTPIVLSGLPDGQHVVEVAGKNDVGWWQDDPVFGEDAVVTRVTWVVDGSRLPVRLNELLASNRRAFEYNDRTPDAVELYNYSNTTVDLSGLRLTDDPAAPDKYEFPAGTLLGPGQYLIALAANDEGRPGYYLDFNLRKEGGGLYLYDAAHRGGALLDQVQYGPQATDYSIGRMPDGSWALCQPTLGRENVPVALGDPRQLRINEWMASSQFSSFNDFVELFNPQQVPVDLSGLYLTDKPDGLPNRHVIAPLSFIGPRNFTVFQATGQPENGPDHLNFRLAAEHGDLALLDRDLRVIDAVTYDFLAPDYSQGRSPNGSPSVFVFSQPTPGAGNPFVGGSTNVITTNIVLVDFTSTWRYHAEGTDLGTTWRNVGYNDAAWPSGPGLFGKPQSISYPIPTGTLLNELGQTTVYFRTRFVYTGETNGFQLALSHYIDDGAVVYLNGTEILRYNMPAGTIVHSNNASASVSGNAPLIGPLMLPLTGLVAGTNVLAVEVHQASGSTDMAMAMNLTLTRSITNITGGAVVINEVFALGENYTNVLGVASDWVELFNPGDQPVNLAGMSLSDNTTNPGRWTFPAGTVLGPRSYLVVLCDGRRPASTNLASLMNTGFGLKAEGGGVYLYDDTLTLLSSVVYGIQLADFSIGRVPNGTGSFVLNAPTPGAANIAMALGNPALLRINEWMPNDRDGRDDWFELYNPGSLPVALGGLFVTDDLLNPTKSPIPPLSFIGGGGTNAFLKLIADNNPAAGADHVRFRLDATRESLGLATSNGYIDTVSWNYPVSQPGVSEGRFPDGSTNIVFFPDTPSPGESNYRPLTNLVINEVLAHSDPPLEDAIELHNLTDQPVNIGGWFLSDSKGTLNKYQIPVGTIIPARGFRVFYEYQFNENPQDNRQAFALSSAKGDELYLSAATTNGTLTGYRTSVKFGPSFSGVSFGRHVTSDGRSEFVPLSRRTFGVDEPNSVAEFRTGTGASNAYPAISPVVIRQIMYHPPDLGTEDNVIHEFIELYNRTTGTVPLYDPLYPTNTWRLRDAVDFEFPPGFSLPPGGSVLVVSFDPVRQPDLLANFRATYRLSTNLPIVGPYRGKLDNSDESIELKQPDTPQQPPSPDAGLVPYVEVERIRYYDRAPWPAAADGTGYSLQRVALDLYGNDPAIWVAAPVNFLQTNAIALNTPPNLAPIPNRTVALGQTLVFTNVASDADVPAQTLTFELAPGAPAGAQVHPVTGVFSWTPAVVGVYPVTVIVRDNGTPSLSATQSFTVTVEDRRAQLVQSGANLQIRWQTQAGRQYQVQYKDRLTDPVWQDLPGGLVTGNGGPVAVPDALVPSRPQRYYRILLLP